MPPNRREFAKAALLAPLVMAVPAAAKPVQNGNDIFEKIEMIAQLEPADGKIVSMIPYHDDIFIATEYGKIYRLHDLWRAS